MSIPEFLGWAKSFLDTLGLTNYIVASVIITLSIGIVRSFFRD